MIRYLLLALMFFLVACEQPAATPTVTEVASPTMTPFQPYPSPPQSTPTPGVSPSIDGYIMFSDGVPDVILSLCEIKYTDEGFRFCVYDPHEMWVNGWRIYADPVTGNFKFYDVPPIEWALVLDMVSLQIIPNYPGEDYDPVVFKVHEGEIVFLELYYSDPFPWIMEE